MTKQRWESPNPPAPKHPDRRRTKAQKEKRLSAPAAPKTNSSPAGSKASSSKRLIPDEVKANPEAYREIESREHRELETTRGEVYWRVTRIPKFALKTDKQEKPITSPAPVASVPGTLCGPQLISQIVCDKFCDHLPHYRQSQRFARRNGIELQRGTINTWTGKLADHLRPINEAIKAEVMDTDALQIDETPGSYLSPGTGKSQTGYWWAYRNVHTSTVYFDWHASRAMDCLLDMLGFDKESKTLLFVERQLKLPPDDN